MYLILNSGDVLEIWFCGCRLFPKGVCSYKSVSYRGLPKIIVTRIISEIQWKLDLRKPDLRKNIDLSKIVATTDFFSTYVVRKISENVKKIGTF